MDLWQQTRLWIYENCRRAIYWGLAAFTCPSGVFSAILVILGNIVRISSWVQCDMVVALVRLAKDKRSTMCLCLLFLILLYHTANGNNEASKVFRCSSASSEQSQEFNGKYLGSTDKQQTKQAFPKHQTPRTWPHSQWPLDKSVHYIYQSRQGRLLLLGDLLYEQCHPRSISARLFYSALNSQPQNYLVEVGCHLEKLKLCWFSWIGGWGDIYLSCLF